MSEVFSQDGIFRRAEQATNIYEKAKEKEEHILNNTIRFIDSTTNNKPHIESVRYLDRTDRTMKIKVMATDKDKENLTYTLFVGTTRENIEKYEETQEKEQGIEVEWEISVEDSKTKYYYKVEVKDQYATVDTGIKETNNAPIIGEINLEKNFDEKTGNWIKVTTSATDTENDEINFALKMWKKETGENEEDIVKNSPTKTEIKTNVLSGEEIEIVVNKLEEYKDYIYRVDIEDKENIVVGNRATIKTYCSGRGLECNDAIPCNVCNETGICNTTLSHYYPETIGTAAGTRGCPYCGKTGVCYYELVRNTMHDLRVRARGYIPKQSMWSCMVAI